MAADDVASAVGRVALGSPVNGTVEIGAPERFRLDELVRRALTVWKDPREVVADPHARYYGIQVSDTTLVPNDNAKYWGKLGAFLGRSYGGCCSVRRFCLFPALAQSSPRDR
jgi:uncharacterized protein YbjT (DUF2867 family)